jgi:ABC-type transporter Mla maintaining outer membrane lipid asymmetry permease subunit MlaE
MRVALVLTVILVAACAAQAATAIVGAKESPQKGPWCGT